MVDATLELFQTVKILTKINATLITLVPQTLQHDRVTNFRPIAYCNTIYKCTSKAHLNRLKKCLPSLISWN